MHILESSSTRIQRKFSDMASCSAQNIAEASTNKGSQGNILFGLGLS